ncbi:MAG: flagellar hook-associated protein FlgK, partial [Candidatus Eremiobacteraeota bacterium]|nr:flagellar hook-associated protein FlgK [Candidatus Eremiobacteraeota bacterium]
MSFFGLDLMGKSLDAFQTAANVVSDNIANVNTPGASRQMVVFTPAPPIVGSPGYATHSSPGTMGDGVLVSQIERIHEDSYDSLFRGASSSQNYFSIQQNQLQALQASLGEPNSGVSSQFAAFQAAVGQLVAQAGGGSSMDSRANVLSQAQALALSLNNAANAVTSQKAQVMQQGTVLVQKVNGILDQIGALNQQIRASTAVGDNPNTFKDQRDGLIDQLSQYLSTQTSIQPDGSTLVSVNGQALVNDAVVYHLSSPVVGTAANGTPTFKIDFGTNPPAPANASGIPLGSGQLAALQDLYNNKLTSYGNQLDSFASALATETNRITESGYDSNGIAGTALFQPIVANLPISASNIQVGIADPSQLPAGLASTAAGTLVVAMNSANNAVNTAAALNGNTSLANPPAAGGITGTLTVNVDGVAQAFNYDTNTTDSSINGFITHFNGAHLGVTASFDTTSQRIVFSRDPANTDLVHRAAQGNNPPTASFTITDSSFVAGTPSASLVGVLGASNINGVQQNSANAFGANDNGAANALLKMFSSNVGVGALQTTSAAAVAPGSATIALPAGVSGVQVGQVLTVDAQPGGGAPQENVTVTGISINPATGIESITATFANAHAGGFSIASAQTQTLGQSYGQFV